MSKHTPGPWLIDHVRRGKYAGSRSIAPQFATAFAYLPPGRDDVQLANARLIAAAPAMLEALRKIVAVQDLSLIDHIDCNCAFCGARAAIRAATVEPVDPRAPDPEKEGVFRDHNCAICADGKRPCVKKNPRDCDTLFARND